MARAVYMCGEQSLTLAECDPCDKLESRVGKLEECCDEVKVTISDIQTELGKKLEQNDILAGDNVSISYNEDGSVTINSSGGGSGLTKTEILTAMGYNEFVVTMTATDGTSHSWRIMGQRADSQNQGQTVPTADGEITKQAILNAMGYTEFEMALTDENDETGTWRIIGEQIS